METIPHVTDAAATVIRCRDVRVTGVMPESCCTRTRLRSRLQAGGLRIIDLRSMHKSTTLAFGHIARIPVCITLWWRTPSSSRSFGFEIVDTLLGGDEGRNGRHFVRRDGTSWAPNTADGTDQRKSSNHRLELQVSERKPSTSNVRTGEVFSRCGDCGRER